MRWFLAHAVVVVSPFGNVTDVEDSRPFVLKLIGSSVSSSGVHTTVPAAEKSIHSVDLDEPQAASKPLSPLSQQVVTYIGGFLLRNTSGVIKCETCKCVVLDYTTGDAMSGEDALIRRRDRGGLFFPSSDVSRICFVCEAVFQATVNPTRASITVLKQQAFLHLKSSILIFLLVLFHTVISFCASIMQYV